jgi:prepilin-type N-terminal cleavage/methylation domain-containing protein
MSLIEVLVALAIFALAAVGLSAAYGNILLARAAMERLDQDDESMRLARAAVLAPEALANKTVRQAGERLSGRVTLSDGTLAEWEAELSSATVDALFLVTLTVRRDGETTERMQSFNLYRPAWAASPDRQARLKVVTEQLRSERGFEGTLGGRSGGGSSSRPSVRRPDPPRGETPPRPSGGPTPSRGGNQPATPPRGSPR